MLKVYGWRVLGFWESGLGFRGYRVLGCFRVWGFVFKGFKFRGFGLGLISVTETPRIVERNSFIIPKLTRPRVHEFLRLMDILHYLMRTYTLRVVQGSVLCTMQEQ